MRGSCKFSLIFRVYSSSFACVPCALWATSIAGATGREVSAAISSAARGRRRDRVLPDMDESPGWVGGKRVELVTRDSPRVFGEASDEDHPSSHAGTADGSSFGTTA